MNLISVESSMISHVGYNEENETLEVHFNSGKSYHYFEVPADIYEELLEADSKGRYMRSNIIDCYNYTRVRRRRRY